MNLTELIDNPEARRKISAVEAAELFLARIARRTPVVRAVIRPTPDVALSDARRVDDARRAGKPLPLDGMTLVLKDNIDVAGVKSANGSPIFGQVPAARDSFVVNLLRDAGAVIVGKAQTTEFMFALASNPRKTSALNPWDRKRVAGASSSGSGSALADDQSMAALGTDTGGSVRMPAAFSGVAALRPTFGIVSTTGVFPLSRSFDTIGPMARSVEDIARLFEVTAVYDSTDSRAKRFVEPNCPRSERLRIGIPEQFFFDECDPEIATAVDAAAKRLQAMGHELVRVDLPLVHEAHKGFTEHLWAEALALHAERLATQPKLISIDVRKRLKLGKQVSAARLVAIIELMHAWRQQLAQTFDEKADVLLTPTTQSPPPLDVDARLGKMPGVTRLTYPWSFGHLPAMSVPCGFTQGGLPIGLQLAGAPHTDRLLLDLGMQYQKVTDWHRRRPAK